MRGELDIRSTQEAEAERSLRAAEKAARDHLNANTTRNQRRLNAKAQGQKKKVMNTR